MKSKKNIILGKHSFYLLNLFIILSLFFTMNLNSSETQEGSRTDPKDLRQNKF